MSKKRKMMGAVGGGTLLALVVAGCSQAPAPDEVGPHFASVCTDQRPGPTNGNRVSDDWCDRDVPGYQNVDINIPESPQETEWVQQEHWYGGTYLAPVPYYGPGYGGAYIPPYGQRINRNTVVVVPAGTPSSDIARGFAGGGGRFTRAGGGLASYGVGARPTVGGRPYASFSSGINASGNSFSGGANGRSSTVADSVSSGSGTASGRGGSGTVSRGGLGATSSGSSGKGGSAGGDSAGS